MGGGSRKEGVRELFGAGDCEVSEEKEPAVCGHQQRLPDGRTLF